MWVLWQNIPQSGRHIALRQWTDWTHLPCCETASVKLTPAVTDDAAEECPFENTLCNSTSSFSVEFISKAESWHSCHLCVYKYLPVCLFLRWLMQGAELGVGLFPLGRNRAAPFTVRKLSLILEGKRKEKHMNKKNTATPSKLSNHIWYFIKLM